MKNWDWDLGEKIVCDLRKWKEKFSLVHDFIVSPDGHKISAPVEIEDKKVTIAVNENTWENIFERVCFAQFTEEDSIICLVLQNYEWTLAKDDSLIEQAFDYAWNLKSVNTGKSIAFNIKKEDSYGVCLNGNIWHNLFFDARDLLISNDGKLTASYVRVKNPPLLDIFSFKEGVWTVAVNGDAWEKSFISVYGLSFSPDSKKVAATVRLSQQEFTVCVDGNLWNRNFLNAWETLFINENEIAVPVRTEKGWSLTINGEIVWPFFNQLWQQKLSADGKIAAVVSTEFGKWTVAVNGNPWSKTFSQAVISPFFSEDGKKVGAVVKENNLCTVAIDGVPWNNWFDRVWNPQFSADGNHCIAKVEKNGNFFVVLDGKPLRENYEKLWEPTFNPDGDKILIRGIRDGKYIRKVVKLSEVLG
ncbi:electron transfer complex subunit TmcD [Thermodesulfovibrio sp.]|uniref:electron transfer complex subunit TmcD n=1 Tax=Thermodesulfovibrio sp. TaxID=2067987 RepID=UPI0030AB9C76